MRRKMFLNLPVENVARTIAFFKALGFEFNKQFTDDKAACMIIGEDATAMLLAAPFFRTFTKKQLCDTRTHCEGLFALSCESRQEVDALVAKAIAAGASRRARSRTTASCTATASRISTATTGR